MLKRLFLLVIVIAAIGWLALNAKSRQENTLQTDKLKEASGLAISHVNPGILYSHNDSGGEAKIYAIDAQGKLCATLSLAGASNRDWEDIAAVTLAKSGQSYIYAGDIGDNAARYNTIKIYRFPEPKLSKADSLLTIQNYDTIEIAYEDGPRDAEALFVDPRSGDIYIISKREEQVGLYRAKPSYPTGKINTAVKLGTLPLSWVTAADLSPNGKKLLVKTYVGIWQFKVNRHKQGDITLSQKPKNLPYKIEPQGEGICWDNQGKGYYTLSEADRDAPQTLYYYK